MLALFHVRRNAFNEFLANAGEKLMPSKQKSMDVWLKFCAEH